MTAAELLRAGGWRQGHYSDGREYWEHDSMRLVRWYTDTALAQQLEWTSARVRELEADLELKHATLVRVADEKRSAEARVRVLEAIKPLPLRQKIDRATAKLEQVARIGIVEASDVAGMIDRSGQLSGVLLCVGEALEVLRG